MHTVDNSEDPAKETRPRIPRRSDPPTATSTADRVGQMLSRAGVAAALVTTAIGVAIMVRADSVPPVRANSTETLSGEPSVQSCDCGDAFGRPVATNASLPADPLVEAPAPAEVAGDQMPTDPRPAPAVVETTDAGPVAPAEETPTDIEPTPPPADSTSTTSLPETTVPTDASAPNSIEISVSASFSATVSFPVQDPSARMPSRVGPTSPATVTVTLPPTATVTADPGTPTATVNPSTATPTADPSTVTADPSTVPGTSSARPTTPTRTATVIPASPTTASTPPKKSTSAAPPPSTSSRPTTPTTPTTTTNASTATKPAHPTPSIAHPPATSKTVAPR
ncbi:hypothetical protein ACIA5E_17745 [Nocardia asteroides]|uniref:hypothetical protein n=1 Tax=Nocardia asteroides TaxID=1824 RepID=UPI00378FAA03